MHFKDWPNTAGFNALGDTRTPIELQVTGKFPDYVAGSLYRTGPGGYKVPRTNPKKGDFACSHWFDGFVTTHRFELIPSGENSGLKVKYTSYSQVDELVEKARKTGKLQGISFGQKRDPCETFYQKLKTVFEPTYTSPQLANVGVTLREAIPAEISGITDRSDRLLTLGTDAHLTKQFDMDTLEPKGVTAQSKIHPALKGQLSAAHASRDPVNGDLYNFNLELPSMTYRVFRVNAQSGEVDILATITGMKGAYIHSMLLTENFLILCVWPAFFTNGGINILWKRSILEAITYDPNAEATWLVIDRRGSRGLVQKFTSPSFFCFHTTNAWEEPSSSGGAEDAVDIHCELVQFPNMDILTKFYYQNLLSSSPGAAQFDSTTQQNCHPSLTRYLLSNIPLSSPSPSASVKTAEKYSSIPAPSAGDLPVINPTFTTKPHRYVWSVIDRGHSSFLDGLAKTDTREKSCIVWERERHTPGEPIFVANPGGNGGEDDGVVLTVVLDGDRGTSYLLCLDARTMQEVARAEVGAAVGFGFHGIHLGK